MARWQREQTLNLAPPLAFPCRFPQVGRLHLMLADLAASFWLIFRTVWPAILRVKSCCPPSPSRRACRHETMRKGIEERE